MNVLVKDLVKHQSQAKKNNFGDSTYHSKNKNCGKISSNNLDNVIFLVRDDEIKLQEAKINKREYKSNLNEIKVKKSKYKQNQQKTALYKINMLH